MSYNQPPNGPGWQPNDSGTPPGWQQQPNNAPGAPGGWQSSPYDQPLGGNPYGNAYSQSSNAVLALILSIVGTLCCCTFMAPVGLYLGKSELDAINSGHADPSQRGMAQAAFVLGIIGTVILVLGILYYLASFLLAF